jgi:predicted RNA polymerase sigma factor
VTQRIVRAARTLSAAGVPFVMPDRDQSRERLASVLEVVSLTFNEGYSATPGERLVRPELMEEPALSVVSITPGKYDRSVRPGGGARAAGR